MRKPKAVGPSICQTLLNIVPDVVILVKRHVQMIESTGLNQFHRLFSVSFRNMASKSFMVLRTCPFWSAP